MAIEVTAMKQMPASHYLYFKQLTDLFNLPHVGTTDNCVNNTVQLNLAGAQTAEGIQTHTDIADKAQDTFKLALGTRFSRGHPDADHSLAYSVGIVGSDLPDDYYPGRFGLLGPGVHWQLQQGTGCMFSGRRCHGGTAPWTTNASVVHWATRALTIAYAPERSLNGMCSWALTPVSESQVADVTPSMMNPRYVR
jgi:hypothetical protein